ncbi:Subtilase-type proteinase psp3 [Halotydeus destructor]|nr:Subtilase-type proteinase psp3 [Halotydeus destructor]
MLLLTCLLYLLATSDGQQDRKRKSSVALLSALSNRLGREVHSQSDCDWGLALMSFPPNENWDIQDGIFTHYFYKQCKVKNVTVYYIGHGMDVHDPELAGYASMGHNFLPNEKVVGSKQDGTFIARKVNGAYLGICKSCQVVNIKVTDDNDTTQFSHLRQAFQWVVQNGVKAEKAIVLTTVYSHDRATGVPEAAAQMVKAGYPLFTFADGEPASGCSLTPTGPFLVSACDMELNYSQNNVPDSCSHLIGPGDDLAVDIIDSEHMPTASHPVLAAALVAGLAGYCRTQGVGTKSPLELYRMLQQFAKKDIIKGVPSSQPNLLAYNGIFESK